MHYVGQIAASWGALCLGDSRLKIFIDLVKKEWVGVLMAECSLNKLRNVEI